MLSEHCRLGLIYVEPREETYVSAPSLLNYLQVLGIDLEQSGNADHADAVKILYEGFNQVVGDFEQEYLGD